MIFFRPSFVFTVLAISNEELWWCSWPQLDRSTGQAAAAFVLRGGVEHEGLYLYILSGYLYILEVLYIYYMSVFVMNSYQMYMGICPNGNG